MSNVIEFIEEQASSPETCPHKLEGIFLGWLEDKRICGLIAQNPNANIWTLIQLAPDYINDIIKNPALPLMTLEQNFDLDFVLLERHGNQNRAICNIKEMPNFLEAWVMSHPDPDLQYEFASAYCMSKTKVSKAFQDWAFAIIYPF